MRSPHNHPPSLKGAPGTAVVHAMYVRPCTGNSPCSFLLVSETAIASSNCRFTSLPWRELNPSEGKIPCSELTSNCCPPKTANWLNVWNLSQIASGLSQCVNSMVSSPIGSEKSGSAVWMVKGVLSNCLSKTSRHRLCLNLGLSFPEAQVLSFSFASHFVAGTHDSGALS